MRPYAAVTGMVFALITLAHVWRLVVKPNLLREPWFIALTVLSGALALTAWRVATPPPAA
jgi:hypothetical protein